MIYRNFLLFLHFSLLPLPGSEKIDGAIDLNNPDFSPVFVRMSDQVVNCAGEYEKQTIDRSEKTRSKNRKEVIGLLQQKSEKFMGSIEWDTTPIVQGGRDSKYSEILDRQWIFLPCPGLCDQENGPPTRSFPDLLGSIRQTRSSVLSNV